MKLVIDNELFLKSIKEDLDEKLKEYNLFKYVEYCQSFNSIEEEHPVLKECKDSYPLTYSSIKMNELLGYDLIPYRSILSAFTVNVFLNAYYKGEIE